MASFAGEFLSLNQIAAELTAARSAAAAAGRPFKLALTIAGGGARGAYEAGAVEALRQAGVVPDLIVGTSAGALVAFGLFVDLIRPLSSTAPFAGSQSRLWKQLSEQNDGAQQIVSRPWLINLVSGKSIGQRSTDLSTLLQTVRSAVGLVRDQFVSVLVGVQTDVGDIERIAKDAVLGEAAVLHGIGGFLTGGGTKAITDAVSTLSTAADDLTRAGNRLIDDTKDIVSGISNNISASAQLIGNAATAVADGLAALDLLDFLRQEFDPWRRVALGSGVIEYMTDCVMTIEPLRETLFAFAERGVNPASSAGTMQSLVAGWLSRASKPEFIVTTTDLHEGRSVLFGLAQASTITALTSSGTWFVDLARGAAGPSVRPGVAPPSTLFFPDASANATDSDRQVIAAVLTSASVPMVFHPQSWNLTRTIDMGRAGGRPLTASQVLQERPLVDGGVGSGSPIDVALGAGATHIISLELTPLNATTIPSKQSPVRPPFPPYTLISIAWDTLNAGMDASQRNSIQRLIAQNGQRSDTDPGKVQLYRLAPLQTRDDSIDMQEFNGKWDWAGGLRMSLYDWFMQGYIDARGLDAAHLQGDSIFIDYTTSVASGFKLNTRPVGNNFWRASQDPTPPRS